MAEIPEMCYDGRRMEGSALNGCMLCPRACGADRSVSPGFCGMGTQIRLARAARHLWEEPCISGEKGSGTVIFSGCTLGCIFCQNRRISREGFGMEASPQLSLMHI